MAPALLPHATLYSDLLACCYSHFIITASVHRHMGSGIPNRHDFTPSCDWDNSNIKIAAVCPVATGGGGRIPVSFRSTGSGLTCVIAPM